MMYASVVFPENLVTQISISQAAQNCGKVGRVASIYNRVTQRGKHKDPEYYFGYWTMDWNWFQ